MQLTAEPQTIVWCGKRHNTRSGRLPGLTQTGRMLFLGTGLLACCSPSLKPIVMTALYTGFRISMLFSPPWINVGFRQQVIMVQAGYVKKSESRPMNNNLHITLKMARISTTGDGPVFCILQGTPCRNFRTACERVRKADIADFTFYDLPYTLAACLVRASVDLPMV